MVLVLAAGSRPTLAGCGSDQPALHCPFIPPTGMPILFGPLSLLRNRTPPLYGRREAGAFVAWATDWSPSGAWRIEVVTKVYVLNKRVIIVLLSTFSIFEQRHP